MIADLKNMTQAAAKLHVAQPYLSRQLKQLEQELGVTLLNRTTREMQLTSAGRVLQQRARELLALRQQSIHEITSVRDGQTGTVKIGVVASINNGIIPAWLAQYHRHYPGVQFLIEERPSSEIVKMLREQRIELGIMRTAKPLSGFQQLELPTVPIVMVGRQLIASEKLAHTGIQILKNQPLLVHRYHVDLITKLCHQAGFEPIFLAQVDNSLTLLRLANKGIGVALIPQDWLDLVRMSHLQAQTLAIPELTRPTTVIWQTSRLSLVGRRFVELIDSQRIKINSNIRLP